MPTGGEQEMLAIARAVLLNPKLMLLDEPSQGLAPLIVQEVFEVVTSAREQGISVLLVGQNVRAAVEIADRAYVLDAAKWSIGPHRPRMLHIRSKHSICVASLKVKTGQCPAWEVVHWGQ